MIYASLQKLELTSLFLDRNSSLRLQRQLLKWKFKFCIRIFCEVERGEVYGGGGGEGEGGSSGRKGGMARSISPKYKEWFHINGCMP